MDENLFDRMAMVYDSMIDWDKRLSRELPFIREALKGRKRILEIGCATGRHCIALSDGFEVIGIDINEKMIDIAHENAVKMNSNAKFFKINSVDITTEDSRFKDIDAVIILANSLANLETEENVIKFLKNMRELMPNGIIIGQTVFLKDEINYLPLRVVKEDNIVVQRIMFPSKSDNPSHILHFNVLQEGTYLDQSLLPLYGITHDKLKKVTSQSNWQIREMYGSYNKDPAVMSSGKTLVWILE